ATALPRMGASPSPIAMETAAGAAGAPSVRARVIDVSDGFFAALAVRPSSGRLLGAPDFTRGAPDAVVVDEMFARRVLGGRDPLGRRIRIPGPADEPPRWREIVGIVPNLGMGGSDRASAGVVYRPMRPLGAFWLAV